MNQQFTWKQINHPDILPGYLISPDGYVKAESIDDKDAFTSSYHSTNGYDFVLLNNTNGELQLFPIDDIIAMAYIPIPESLKDKKIKVSHINGDTRDISLDNLQWIEDIEEWKPAIHPFVDKNKYMVSSWGNVKNVKTGRILNPKWFQGYMVVTLCGHTVRVHRLVGLTFISRIDNNNVVNHINGVGVCNYWKNLEWVTPKRNAEHAALTNLIRCGVPDEAFEIIEKLLNEGKSPKEVYDLIDKNKYSSVTYNTIVDAKRGQYGTHLTVKPMKSKHGKKTPVTTEIADEIRDVLIDEDFCIANTFRRLKDKYPFLTYTMIKKLKQGIRYMFSNKYDLSEFNKLAKKNMKG